MRKTLLSLLVLALAQTGWASTNFFLDRTGILWTATATENGLRLTGQRGDQMVVEDQVPFPIRILGTTDTNIQVVADELTGKVVVVWQRNWSETASEILAATWRDGAWSEIDTLSADPINHPRNPRVQLSKVETNTEDGPIADSFLQVLWWEGLDVEQNGTLAVARLTADSESLHGASLYNLDDFVPIAIACGTPAPAEVLEHPLFAASTSRDRSLVFYGSVGDCFFYLIEVEFELEPPNDGDATQELRQVAQRRRHMPIFGVKKVFLLPQDYSLEGARVLIGSDLVPVAYKVSTGKLEYVVGEGVTWTEPRSLKLEGPLTVDQAIPLVERLAH